MKPVFDRRTLCHAASGLLIASAAGPYGAQAEEAGQSQDVTASEDLMREHGVLNRVLLVYEAGLLKLSRSENFDVAVLSRAAEIVHEFIEDYHERNDQAGRRLTDTIRALVPTSQAPGESRSRLIASIQGFIAMYRPHEAREDTELFPKLRSIVSANEFDAMGEDFERDERRKFGEDGFKKYVAQVVELERTLGINDLAQFTPA
jgi:hemerythrin-like domain-containing protein